MDRFPVRYVKLPECILQLLWTTKCVPGEKNSVFVLVLVGSLFDG